MAILTNLDREIYIFLRAKWQILGLTQGQEFELSRSYYSMVLLYSDLPKALDEYASGEEQCSA